MRVCICGGGNAVHVMASDMGTRDDLWVGIYAPYQDEAERFQAGLDAAGGFVSRRLRGDVTHGEPDAVSAEAADVVPGADVVLIPLPSYSHEGTLQAITPHLKEGCIIVALPGQGGFNWVARNILGDQRASRMIIAGTNQLPYQCRILKYGAEVELIGYKRQIQVATEPRDAAEVVGDAGMVIGIDDYPAMAKACEQIVRDATYRQQLIEAGTSRVGQFSVELLAMRMRDVYQSAVSTEA